MPSLQDAWRRQVDGLADGLDDPVSCPGVVAGGRSVSLRLRRRNHVRCSDPGQRSSVFLHLTDATPKPMKALA
jgi:hypothetical protein